MSKGSMRRPCQTGRDEEALRWALAMGKIRFAEFEARYKQLYREGKITRVGRRRP